MSLVLFPVLVENNEFYLFSNNYFKNWNVKENDKNNNEFVNYILPLESLEDIQFIETNKDKLESIDPKEILLIMILKTICFWSLNFQKKRQMSF